MRPPDPTDDPPDDLKHSFYLQVIRARIGEELRYQLHVTEPLPDRLAELLKELDDEREDVQ